MLAFAGDEQQALRDAYEKEGLRGDRREVCRDLIRDHVRPHHSRFQMR